MVSVIILIRARVRTIWEACQSINKIEGVQQAHAVTGPYDIIAYAELPSTEDIRRMAKSIHEVEGVTRTETCIGI